MERYYSYSRFLKEMFGEKIYKISLNGGFTCPNRDGTPVKGRLHFLQRGRQRRIRGKCRSPRSPRRSTGERAQSNRKYSGGRYIAYFQAFTNTYAPVERLRALYEAAIRPEEIAAIAIGTRPDCLPEEVLNLSGGDQPAKAGLSRAGVADLPRLHRRLFKPRLRDGSLYPCRGSLRFPGYPSSPPI